MPSVYDYTDYHRYLGDYYLYLKSLDSKYSYRYICGKTGIKSTGHLSLILQGKTHISHLLTMRFVELCKLKKREAEYFRYMVLYGQAKTHEEKRGYFEKMARFAESAVHQVHADQYKFYSKWYHSAVWAVLDLHDTDGGDPGALGRLVEPSISASRVRSSLRLLESLGLVSRNDKGLLKPTHAVIDTGTRPPPVAVNNFAIRMLEMAREALDRFPREERSLSWGTVTLSERGYREVQREVRNFRRRVLHIAENDSADRVYQVNVQIFPLSKRVGGRRDGGER
jgi:uncharacterized protein (TIGR02147 family)